MYSIKEENRIMREYYKLDKEPSSEIQAKVLTNLKVHDLEFQIMQEKMNALNQQQHYLALTAAYSVPFIPRRYY